MDKRSLERFQNLLEAKRKELLHAISEAEAQGKLPVQVYGSDEGDRAHRSHDKELLLHQAMQNRALIRTLDAALSRIADRSFGGCMHCGEEIGSKRLEALPWARYCISCQELLER